MLLRLNIFIAILLAFGAAQAAEMMDRVLVIVNEDVITQSDFDYRMEVVASDFQEENLDATRLEQISKQLLGSMVSELLQVQETERRGINVDDAEVDAAVERFAGQQNMTVEQLEAAITSRGDSISRFHKSVRDSLNISRLTEFYALSRVVIPEYEIDGHIANNIGDAGTEYQVAHLLINNPEENEDLGQQVLDEILAGLSFEQAVITYSEAADAQEGGLLGWRTDAQLPDIFVAAIKEIDVGGVTDVLRTENGLHILKLLDLKGTREEIIQHEVRHILISAETDVARTYAKKRLSEIRQRLLAGEDFETLARIYSDDSVSAANGGDLGWVSPGEMVPQFENTYNTISLNEISEPFDTNFGVHILQVEDRRTKNITDQVIRSQADNLLRRQRTEREFPIWVRELEQESYIQYLSDPTDPKG